MVKSLLLFGDGLVGPGYWIFCCLRYDLVLALDILFLICLDIWFLCVAFLVYNVLSYLNGSTWHFVD